MSSKDFIEAMLIEDAQDYLVNENNVRIYLTEPTDINLNMLNVGELNSVDDTMLNGRLNITGYNGYIQLPDNDLKEFSIQGDDYIWVDMLNAGNIETVNIESPDVEILNSNKDNLSSDKDFTGIVNINARQLVIEPEGIDCKEINVVSSDEIYIKGDYYKYRVAINGGYVNNYYNEYNYVDDLEYVRNVFNEVVGVGRDSNTLKLNVDGTVNCLTVVNY